MKKTRIIFIAVAGVLAIAILLGIYLHQQPYYKKFHYVAHALGGIDNTEYTNSKEAMEYSYEKGFRLLEVDFLFTSDKRLVARHKWADNFGDSFSEENIPTYEEFMATKIGGIYTPIGIEEIIQFAKEHPDVYFITDTKNYETDMNEMLRAIEDTSKSLGYTEFSEHFIVQFYTYENYEDARDNFEFKNYMFTLYQMKKELRENGIDNILEYCLENNIKVVTVPDNYASAETISKLKANGITTYVHTIDGRKQWFELQLIGIDGIYTNYIYPGSMYVLYAVGIGAVVISIILAVLFIRYIKKRVKRRE